MLTLSLTGSFDERLQNIAAELLSSERSEETLPALMDRATDDLRGLRAFRVLGVTNGRYGLTVRLDWLMGQCAEPGCECFKVRQVVAVSGPAEESERIYASALEVALTARSLDRSRGLE